MTKAMVSRKKAKIKLSPITTDVNYCARCKGNHTKLTFKPFGIACDNFSHWALCPTNQEPILMTVLNYKEKNNG